MITCRASPPSRVPARSAAGSSRLAYAPDSLRLRAPAAASFAGAGTNLHVSAGHGNRLVLLLDPELDAIVAGGLEDFRRGEMPLDLALACFVRIAVDGLFRNRSVSPFPLDRRAVELLVIVRAALQVGGDDNASGRERDHRVCLDGDVRFAFIRSTSSNGQEQCNRERQ